MDPVKSMDDLKRHISKLEDLQHTQLASLKLSASSLIEDISPSRIIKSTLHNVASSPEVKANVLEIATGLITGYLSRKIVVKNSSNIFKKITGSVLQYFVTNLVAKKIHKVRTGKE